MLLELVFTTRLLGLVSGDQGIEVRVDRSVRKVDIVADGERIAKLGPPYRLVLHFGSGLVPHELTSIAYDADGNEVGRDTQLVNLARPRAEAAIDLDRDAKSGRLRAKVRWQHIVAAKPKRIELKLDGKRIATEATALLPPLPSDYSIHVLEAKVEFRGGTTAAKELVFGGRYSEHMPTELTSVIGNENTRCFQSGERIVRAAAIEKPDANIYFVRSGDAGVARHRLHGDDDRPFSLAGVKVTYLWPSPSSYRVSERRAVIDLFDGSGFFDGNVGTLRFLTKWAGPDRSGSERFADAVAVSAVQSLAGAKRRAVVLVLGGERDDSQHTAGAVRRYLERIGVPLRVWSLIGVTPQLTAEWGDVIDISNPERLRAATDELRRMIDEQRIVWLPLHPLQALQAKPADCR